MISSRVILAHDKKKYFAAVCDKYTTTFQPEVTTIQTFSIYGIYMYVVVVLIKLLVVYVYKLLCYF